MNTAACYTAENGVSSSLFFTGCGARFFAGLFFAVYVFFFQKNDATETMAASMT